MADLQLLFDTNLPHLAYPIIKFSTGCSLILTFPLQFHATLNPRTAGRQVNWPLWLPNWNQSKEIHFKQPRANFGCIILRAPPVVGLPATWT